MRGSKHPPVVMYEPPSTVFPRAPFPSRRRAGSYPRRGLLDPESPLGRALRLDLGLGQRLVDLLHLDELLDLHDHTRELGADGVEDRLRAAAQAKSGEYAPCPLGEADGGSVE